MIGKNSRKGITPVVAVVLLLMMTVAAAGAAYTWFSQMQEQLQNEARTQLQTDLSIKDLRCNAEPENTVEIALKNNGDTSIDLRSVDLFIRDSSGHLNATVTDMDLSEGSACNGGDCGFSDPGGFAQFTVDISDPTNDPGSGDLSTGSGTLYAGNFYNLEISFTNDDISLPAGGCTAE